MKYWWNISVLKSVSPCRKIFVIEKLSVGTITMSLVGNTICHHEKKKEKKRKENLHGSEQNVVGVKEIAQG